MAATKAQNKQQVDAMSKRDRLWDSLSYSYGQKTDQSNKAYDQQISQTDRQMQARGMGRSSYGMQTLANLGKEKINSANNIYSEQIADYENRLGQIESEEAEAERWERQFAEGQRQFNETQAYNRERAAASDAQWEKNYQMQLDQFNRNMEYQRERAGVSDAQWEKTYQANLDQFNKQFAENQRQYDTTMAYNQAQTDWNQKFQQEQANIAQQNTLWNQKFQESEAARAQKNTEAALAWDREQFERNFGRQTARDTVSDDQWEKSFNQSVSESDRAAAMTQVQLLLQNGGYASDELLAQAGISRADYTAMLNGSATPSGATSSSGGSPGNTTKEKTPDEIAQAQGWASAAEKQMAAGYKIYNPSEWALFKNGNSKSENRAVRSQSARTISET